MSTREDALPADAHPDSIRHRALAFIVGFGDRPSIEDVMAAVYPYRDEGCPHPLVGMHATKPPYTAARFGVLFLGPPIVVEGGKCTIPCVAKEGGYIAGKNEKWMRDSLDITTTRLLMAEERLKEVQQAFAETGVKLAEQELTIQQLMHQLNEANRTVVESLHALSHETARRITAEGQRRMGDAADVGETADADYVAAIAASRQSM